MGSLTRRSFLFLGAALFLEAAFPRVAFAHEKRSEHDEEFEAVFLGDSKYRTNHKGRDDAKAVAVLESAIYLCIDQVQEDGVKDLELLNEYGVRGLPKSVSEINPPPGEKQLSGTNHHFYTHRGWDMDYGQDDKANWELRKKILLNTVEKVFGFRRIFEFSWPPSEMLHYDKKCNSFAALAYYVHVLGDYLEDDSVYKFDGLSWSRKIKFAYPHAGKDNRDIFYEIEEHLKVVFSDQKSSLLFTRLLHDLGEIARKARNLAGSTGGIDNDEKLNEALSYAEELMALLSGVNKSTHGKSYHYSNRVHDLLVKEPFFSSVFPD